MWIKNRRTNSLLEPLAQVISGTLGDGEIVGSYLGYGARACIRRGFPISYLSDGPTDPEPVNMLHVSLSGVAGSQTWHCQSSASSAVQDLVSRFTAGSLLRRFTPGEFKFEGADMLSDAIEHMAEKLLGPLSGDLKTNADPALQERLIAAGLFDQLDELRLGAHPYLPRVQFTPGARELGEQIYMRSGRLDRVSPVVEERLRAAGRPDLHSLIEAKLQEAEETSPGRLELDVEAGKDRTLSPTQFQGVLERLVRIGEINKSVNQGVGAR